MASTKRTVAGLLIFLAGCNVMTAKAQLHPDSIQAAYQYSASHSGRALIIKEQGKVRFEQYYNGLSKGTPLHIYSGTKSFFSVLAVIAQEEGLLILDEKVSDTITEWKGDPRKSRITIRELLNFTSGMETGFNEIYGRSSADKLKLSLQLDAMRDRGKSFIYGPSHLQIFCEVLNRKLAPRGIEYEQYLNEKLIHPLGIRITRWREDAHGNVIPSAGMYMTGQHWMNFGDMVLAGGKWKGRQLVRTDSLVQCFQGTEINPSFGLCFWLNSYKDRPDAWEVDVEETLEEEPLPEDWRACCLAKGAPADLVVSLGSTFQRLYIVPSMQLVIVHHGKPGHDFRDYDFLRILFEDAGVPDAEVDSPPQKRQTRPLLKKLFGGDKE
ncbi:MAG: serine hydrolase [Verrucomicrobiales bacterium]|nr:serine hydrolase [Verrucomicrobiales bacterium]